MNRSSFRWLVVLLLPAAAQPAFAAGTNWGKFAAKPDEWYRGAEGKGVIDNVLSHQSPRGSWPKNVDTTAGKFAGDPAKIQGTFDNGATVGELRFLARAFRAAGDDRCRAAVVLGLDHVLTAQYPTGGWPQFHPPGTGYHRHITFNDNTMVNLLKLLRDVAAGDGFAFAGADRRAAARAAFDKGITCILKCQVVVNGAKTAWCAQHDEVTFQPRPGRTYELVSLSGAESVEITRLLMSLDNPSPEVVAAVKAAAAWFGAAKLTGIRVELRPDPQAPKGTNKVVVADPAAPPLWARFYDLTTNRPIFVDRDGVPKPALADIGYERRNGYAWYGQWPAKLLAEEYPVWAKKWVGMKEP